jgi:hypothetical protein
MRWRPQRASSRGDRDATTACRAQPCRGPFAFLILLLWQASPPAFGVQFDDLYVAEVLATGQSDRHVRTGARTGFRQVLVRVSGDTEVDRHPIVAKAIRSASDYYYQFSFDSTDKTLQDGDKEVAASKLSIHFEPSAVASLLREAGFPVWGSNRPGVLVWLAVDEGAGRELLREDLPGDFGASLVRDARRRGLPLQYPLLDLEDAARLDVRTVWGQFRARIAEASSRYEPECILTGRVYLGLDGEWVGNWSFEVDGKWYPEDGSFETVALGVDDLVGDVVDQLADLLARRYAIDSSQGHIWVRVDGVDSLQDYAGLSSYLTSLTPVLDTFVTEVNGDEVAMRLSTEGKPRQLLELIELDEQMVLMPDNARGDGAANSLRFRWLR